MMQKMSRTEAGKLGGITGAKLRRKKALKLREQYNTNPKYCENLECKTILSSEWRGHRLPLDLDHIDGNPENDFPQNLRLLCGNCHSITPTWKGRNKGNGRKSRGLNPH